MWCLGRIFQEELLLTESLRYWGGRGCWDLDEDWQGHPYKERGNLQSSNGGKGGKSTCTAAIINTQLHWYLLLFSFLFECSVISRSLDMICIYNLKICHLLISLFNSVSTITNYASVNFSRGVHNICLCLSEERTFEITTMDQKIVE